MSTEPFPTSFFSFCTNRLQAESNTSVNCSAIWKWKAGVSIFLCFFHFKPKNIDIRFINYITLIENFWFKIFPLISTSGLLQYFVVSLQNNLFWTILEIMIKIEDIFTYLHWLTNLFQAIEQNIYIPLIFPKFL